MPLDIPDLGDLLKGHIKGSIVNQNVSRLTAPGENYGSLMLKVDITVNNSGKEEIIHTVAKCVMPNKRMQDLFNIQITFKNEIGWYKDVIPTLKAFQREKGVEEADFFMDVYGTRISLNPASTIVDEGGVILCENLLIKGYKNIDRRIGFNLEQSHELIKALAGFHAVTLSLKLQRPDVFDEKVKRYLHKRTSEEEVYNIDDFSDIFKELEKNPEIVNVLPRIKETLKQNIRELDEDKKPREPWATAIHTDYWVNNMMLKETDDQKPKVMILDLQTCDYGAPCSDLIFFLGTSVQNVVIENHFDELTLLYYNTFIYKLQELETDVTEFTYENFKKELDISAPGQLLHIYFFIAIVLAVGDRADASADEFVPESEMNEILANFTYEHMEKYLLITKKFVKRNWLL